MKIQWYILFALMPCTLHPQAVEKTRNIFVITTDGFRWQEIFDGADSLLINNTGAVADTALCKTQFWDADPISRRKKLMPFFWNVVAEKGIVFGNRHFNNRVDFRNIYKISYPGYNELFSGYADPYFIPNLPLLNKNTSVFEFINNTAAQKGKVVAFSSWNVFPFILNEARAGIPVNSGYEAVQEENDSLATLINQVQNNVTHKGKTRYDGLTYINAMEYVRKHHPHVVLIGFGETDQCAHAGKYDLYLQKAADVDRMIAQLWYYIQTDPFYRNNTSIIITTDHGRGKQAYNWSKHSLLTKGSGQAWLAMMGPGIAAKGECNEPGQLYQTQVAPTIAKLMGMEFTANHKMSSPIATGEKPTGYTPASVYIAPVSAR